MRPGALLVAMLAGLAPPPREDKRPGVLGRCKFCRALLGEYAAVDGHLAHPPNRCRYGAAGNCAVPMEHVQGIEAPPVAQLTPFVMGQRVTVLPPRVDVETGTECEGEDFAGEWTVVNRGRDTDGVWHYQLKRPGSDAEPLVVQHEFLVAA